MFLGNQGLVTQVNIKSSGNVVISPLSTSVGWASTGGLAVTSTGLTVTGGSTSVDISTGGSWASTGGLKITSTGFPTSTSIDIASGNIVISTGKVVLYTSTGAEGTKLTDGTYTEAVSSNSAMRAGIWDYPTAGIPVKNPTGVPLDVTVTNGTQDMPTMDSSSRPGYVNINQYPVTTINEYNISLAASTTEYSQALPAGTKTIEFATRASVDIRYAFTSGKVAGAVSPYFTLKSGQSYWNDGLNLSSSKTVYFATTSAAGEIVELLIWT